MSPVVVITGGGGSLGRATAVRLASLGYDVVVTGRTPETLHATVSEVESLGARALSVAGDVSDELHVIDVFEAAVQGLGGCDALVHAAGMHGTPMKLVDVSGDEWDSVIANNLKSAFLCTRTALRYMLSEGKGSIVLVGSPGILRGFPLSAPYTTAKSALLGFVRSVAAEVSPQGVRINVITPGPTPEAAIFKDAMPLIAEGMGSDPAESVALLQQMTALRRVCTPVELAKAVSFLVTEDSSLVTGQNLIADAGLTV